MWTLVRFSLRHGGDYRAAFDLLAPAGFRLYRRPEDGGAGPFPAAVVSDAFQDPAAITRAVFEGLVGAGLAPVGVSACRVGVPLAEAPRRALARA
jgi:hypothetical protein